MKTLSLTLALTLLSGLPLSADTLQDFDRIGIAPSSTETAIEAKSVADVMEDMAENDPAIEVTHNDKGEVDGMVMLSDVLFGYDEATLSPEAIHALENLAKSLDGIAGLELVGHTDSIGSSKFNQKLGQARADAVATWLVESGYVDPAAIVASSAGESEPLAQNRTESGEDDPDGRARNRRVAFHIIETGKDEAAPADVALLN